MRGSDFLSFKRLENVLRIECGLEHDRGAHQIESHLLDLAAQMK
jgi:hypothetical protein